MAEQIRGLFTMESPPGGLDRLRRALQRDEPHPPWTSLMPWAATAILLFVTAAPMLAASRRSSHAGAEATARIVDSVREQEYTPWTPMPGGRDDVRVYIALLTPADSEEARPAGPPER